MHIIKKTFVKEFGVFSPNDLVSLSDTAYLGAADVYRVARIDEPDTYDGGYNVYLEGNTFPISADLFEEAEQFINHRGEELGAQTVERLRKKIAELRTHK